MNSAFQIQIQGHKATGNLINSLDSVISQTETTTTVAIEGNDYGIVLDTGRRKGAKQPPIEDLIKWVMQKGIASTSKMARSVAWAIAKAIVREGSPTKGAFKFSRNGKRTGWIDDAIKQTDVEALVAAEGFEEIEIQINTLATGLAVSLGGKVIG